MWKIGLAGAALACLGSGGQSGIGPNCAVVSKSRAIVSLRLSAAAKPYLPMSDREVVWRPDPNDANPFGFIPTNWTTKPQLLPGTWEIQTVFASDHRRIDLVLTNPQNLQ